MSVLLQCGHITFLTPFFMRSVNKIILMGNLGADPELKTTKTGKSVATFSLATSNEWRDKEGEVQKSTDFHRVVAWQKMADHCHQYLKKGSPVYVEGQLHNRTYEDKEKKKHYVNEITADRVNFISTQKSKEGDKVVMEESEEMVAA